MQPDERDPSVEPVSFTAADGTDLRGDLATLPDPRAAAIVCHPHPLYGGDRHHPVVDALFRALPAVGVSALRFDFRARYGDGHGEILDARAAVDTLAAAAPDVPVVAAGYSFGAIICLALDDGRVTHRLLVAPPLTMAPQIVALPEEGPQPPTPTLLLLAAHDQFCPPDDARPLAAAWPGVDVEVLPAADHFLVGASAAVADQATRWLERQLA